MQSGQNAGLGGMTAVSPANSRSTTCTDKEISRRGFLGAAAAFGAAMAMPAAAWSALESAAAPPRSLRLHCPHTGETLEAEYYSNGVYQPDALRQIDFLLRDYHTDTIHRIDFHLLDLLHAMTLLTKPGATLYVLSGYRTRSTNRILRTRSAIAAKNSLHVEGMAADVYIPGHDTRQVRKAAASLKGGGVGYYPMADFVHVDTGPIRYWSAR